MTKTVKFKLEINLEVDLAGEDPGEIVHNLEQIANLAAGEGLFTRCLDSEVVVWEATATRVGA